LRNTEKKCLRKRRKKVAKTFFRFLAAAKSSKILCSLRLLFCVVYCLRFLLRITSSRDGKEKNFNKKFIRSFFVFFFRFPKIEKVFFFWQFRSLFIKQKHKKTVKVLVGIFLQCNQREKLSPRKKQHSAHFSIKNPLKFGNAFLKPSSRGKKAIF
jgi:hypothetical protein